MRSYTRRPLLDLGSRGEVVRHLTTRLEGGLIKDCRHIKLDRVMQSYLPECELDWAKREEDTIENTPVGYGSNTHIKWPRCPPDCPHYSKAEDFIRSAGRDQYDPEPKVTSQAAEEPKVAADEGAFDGTSGPMPIADEAPVVTPVPEKFTVSYLFQHLSAESAVKLIAGAIATLATVAGTAFWFGVQWAEMKASRAERESSAAPSKSTPSTPLQSFPSPAQEPKLEAKKLPTGPADQKK